MLERGTIKDTAPIAELTNGIILASFEKTPRSASGHQSEADLEKELIENLVSQGYERLYANSHADLYKNLRTQIERLNDVKFTDADWERLKIQYIDAPNDGIIEKTRKIHEDYRFEFEFEFNGDKKFRKNIYLIDKKNIHKNFVQVANQVVVDGECRNRYDVTILVNGLPLVHIELKRRGVKLRHAFEQIQRYGKESFNSDNSLYKYVQIFVISNGTFTRYFANTTLHYHKNYEFTCEWADAENKIICDLVDFTKTFFEKRVLLEILTKYCVFDVNNNLLVMRPYQIAATERILWKIKSSYDNCRFGTKESGGYIWHTTGSGKTLTSYKAARLATDLEFIDKVFFVVDRKDLDFQTMKEYQRFHPESVNGSNNINGLKNSIEKNDNRIVVTTIQKLNEFVKKYKNHPIYNKHCVIIYDECHRTQFGSTQKNIKQAFKKHYQFGFTGTPIFEVNHFEDKTTSTIFGTSLHEYIITHAIRDGKVLKFKVDYNNISLTFRDAETETDEDKLVKLEELYLCNVHRITEITRHILKIFNTKTHRNEYATLESRRANGFNAMFAVQSIKAAKLYYEAFENEQRDLPEDKRLRVALIYSPKGDEDNRYFEYHYRMMPTTSFADAIELTDQQFLAKTIEDYNTAFRTNFSCDGDDFQNYYKDISKRVQDRQVDLLIVVNMFLTGFDAPTLNTLFVDKNLRYHNLIQSFSRTNRIYNQLKPFGNIVCFRDLEEATRDALKLYGDEDGALGAIERPFNDYIYGYIDQVTKERVKGYLEVCDEIATKFPNPTEIFSEREQKEFVVLFGELLKLENLLRNYDEFITFDKPIDEREMQDLRSVYLNIRDKVISKPRKGPEGDRDGDPGSGKEDDDPYMFDDVEFYIELFKTDEINLDYIIDLLSENSNEDHIMRVMSSHLELRHQKPLVQKYIAYCKTKPQVNYTKEELVKDFYIFAKADKQQAIQALIIDENLKVNPDNLNEDASYFINKAISKGYVEHVGLGLDKIIPHRSRRNKERQKKKEVLLEKIGQLVLLYAGI